MTAKKIIKNVGQLASWSTEKNNMVVLENVEILIENERIQKIDSQINCPDCPVIDAHNKLVTPGFVDPHTHPVFYNTREMEFEMRLQGKTYQEIAKAGGGILASARKLREAPQNELKKLVKLRLDEFFRFGTTTIEAKSGYGLSVESEIESLKILKQFKEIHPLDIKTTFLGAHEYPEKYRNDHQGYIDLITNKMIPEVAEMNLADYADVFCEEGVFSAKESKKVLQAAKDHGLGIRLHSDEFKPIGGTQLARDIKAISADHLTAITEDGISALKEGNVIPILLPATTYFLGSDKYAPARRMLEQALDVALATDFNPGSSMTQSMPFVINVACLNMKMTPKEALKAATYNSARALEMENLVGSIEPNKQADIVIWNCENYQGIPYFLAAQTVEKVVKKGELVWENRN
ncbi:MAG: imidazolonepropionase [Candidatus Marinimicrobia bacterium]|nr:imidazolonepropionase [Candidatus Neomarinimicrobiota bacterium]